MSAHNGHRLNGTNGHPPKKGDTGGAAHPPGRVRSSLRMLQSLVAKGQSLLDSDFDSMLTFARNVRDDPSASVRDKIRANELIAAIIHKAADKAVDLDKIERLDGGEDTERATIRVQYADESSNRMGNLHAP